MSVKLAGRQSALWAAVGLITFCAGCGDATGGNGGSFPPVWIHASWSGGARGAPNDRTDREPESFSGQLCPASGTSLTNWGGEFAGLNIVNNCTITTTYYLCATRGVPEQPQFGLDECATDPFDTPRSMLRVIVLNPGPEGDYINATPDFSVDVFYCSDNTQLFTEPLRCVGF